MSAAEASSRRSAPGTLWLVGTPIGNRGDLTPRAREVLARVAVVACEDTRTCRTLFSWIGAPAPELVAYHDHSAVAVAPGLVARLVAGEDLALVTDAGMPAIQDPGYRLVVAAREAGVAVVPVPGPSALVLALAASGLPTDRFAFEGFLPAKRRERREKLQALGSETRTLAFYEAPHRIRETLADMVELFGDRAAVVGREVTKLHEEFIRGRLSDALAAVEAKEPRGEITLVVAGFAGEKPPAEAALKDEIDALLSQGLRVKEIAEILGEKFDYPKKNIYRMVLERGK